MTTILYKGARERYANYLHEAPNKKSFLLVRFTSTFKSFIIPLKVSDNEILLCYTEGTVHISYI